jgi:flagellar basal-body rod protein FlgB
LGGSIRPAWADLEAGIVYPVPFNPSLDNNTVEIGVEQARYGRAIVDYQASFQFMENKISGLRKAFKGE